MKNDDGEVAALYQVPLGEFTAARNALARKLGAAGADIRRLEKPHAAAWAVNQLFWQRRADYDALTEVAGTMRNAHARMLSGRKADVAQAESRHDDIVRAAAQTIRELASAAGETLSAETLKAVTETLRALPSEDLPGQLTRPLKPLGFSALIALGVRSAGPGPQRSGSRGSEDSGSAKDRKSRTSAVLARQRAAAKKEAAERAAKKKALRKAVGTARARETAAEAALADSRKALAKVERDCAVARDRVQFLEKQRDDAERNASERARALQDAANTRLQAEQELDGEPD